MKKPLLVGLLLSVYSVLLAQTPPSISVQPVNATGCAGGVVAFSVTAEGAEPLSYQWLFNETNALAGATNASLGLTNIAAANGGGYSVVVTNVDGATTSSVVTLTVNALTTASALASTNNVCPGAPVTFTTTAGGTGPFSYVWRKNGEVLAETSAALSIASVSAGDAGTYTVEVTGTCNSVTNSANLTLATAPVITVQPRNQTTPMGNGAAFSVTATAAGGTLGYQWQTNGVAVAGATASTFTISNLSLVANGTQVRVAVTTCAGTTLSSAATLSVTPISGISFDFDTPGQFTNMTANLFWNNWINNAFITPLAPFESLVGGTGPFPGSGALDLQPNNATDSTSILLPIAYDFSSPGKTLYASTMVKIKSPAQNNRNTQFGFVTSTNIGINDTTVQGFMTVVLQSSAQPAPTFELRQQRRTSGGGLIETTPVVGTPLVSSNWYRINAAFINDKGAGNSNYIVIGSVQDMGVLGTTPGVTNMSFRVTNAADIVNFSQVYFALRGYENTGVDYRDNTYVWTTGGPLFFVQQPQSQTVVQGQRVALKAFVDGEGPYTYQWFRNGTLIEGARAWNYIIPPATTSDNGAAYHVVVTGPANTVTSEPATLTVIADELKLVSVGSVDGTTVGVKFSQPVNEVTAKNPANYTIDGVPAVAARVYRTSAGIDGPNGIYVVLTPASILSAPYTVTVQNVTDLSGNTIGSVNSTNGRVENLTGTDINPVTAPAGEQYSFGPGEFIVVGGGLDIWNNSDSYHYVSAAKSGDFDVVVKVPYMDAVRTSSKAGLSVRTSLDWFSPQVLAAVNPWLMAGGRNYYEGVVRHHYNTASASWGNTPPLNNASVWLRMRRVGNTFMRYSSTNGVNWLFDGQISPNPALPENVYLGLAVCSVANGVPMTAQFSNFGPFAGYAGATIAITAQPANTSVAAGATANISGLVATVTGGGIPATAGEVAYIWQRSNGAGGWTNMPTAGVTNNILGVGGYTIADNGAQFRAIVTAPGALSVTSSVATLTVTDTGAPTVSSVANSLVLPGYSVSDIVITFSEAMGASALNTANYTVTNASGFLSIASIEFLNGDPRTVVLKMNGILGTGTIGVVMNNIRDLNNVPISANTTRTFRSFAPPTAPVVIEVYQDIGNGTAVANLTTHNLFTNAQPTFITYSNLFGYNVGIGNSQDNYGVKAYTWFVPPTNGQYKFWLRHDDAAQLWMNTNGPDVVIPTTWNVAGGERAQNAVDRNPSTKYLNFDRLNTGFAMSTLRGTVVSGLRFTTANDGPERDPMTFTLEGTTGDLYNGPWTVIASGSTELTNVTTRTTAGPIVSFANTTSYTGYRLRFPTVRTPASANSMQIAEVEFLDAANNNVAGGQVLVAEHTGASGNYTVGSTPANSRTNLSLVGGQPYYLEFLLKEGGGNDGFSVMWTDTASNAAPANTAFIPTTALAFPANAAKPTPVVMEFYTGYTAAGANNGNIQNLMASTNHPGYTTYPPDLVNFKYIAGIPDIVTYQPYFSAQPTLGNSRIDNYLGRIVSYFVPPTNGNYKFYIRSDDSSVFFMNTNAVNSTDPFGKTQFGFLPAYTNSGAWFLAAQNISLIAGQKYYIEGLWKEGTGGDGMGIAVRSQGDATLPALAPAVETIPASMLAYPSGQCRAGSVTLAGISPSNPTAKDGDALLLSAMGITGGAPYGYIWYRNGERVQNGSYLLYTPPLTTADNGVTYTLVVTNAFSAASNSTTINVVADNAAPSLVRSSGYRYNDGFSLLFNEALDPESATFLGNYQISGGVTILSASLDATRTLVTFATTPQAVGTTYTVTYSGIKDASSTANAASGTTTFSTWSIGGNALLVEIFANVQGGAIQDLVNAPKFQAGQPDFIYYTNRFVIGLTNANSGLDQYGARISGYFIPTNTGYYRFYIRADDSAQLWMNVNSTDSENPAGRVMLIHSPNANTSVTDVRSMSMPVYLNGGQKYYIEGLLKEGGGGDYFQMAFRETDAAGTALAGAPPEWESALASAFDGVPGNPDLIQIVATPPTDLTVDEGTLASLYFHAQVPAAIAVNGRLQWQKYDGVGGFTNIPNANGTNLTFTARMADDGRQYRIAASYPGLSNVWVTTMHVVPDTTAPFIVSAGSLNGKDITVVWNEPINPNNGVVTLYYDLNGLEFMTEGDGLLQPDQRTVYFRLTPDSYFTAAPYTVGASSVENQAQTPIMVGYTTSGDSVIEHLETNEIGSPVVGNGGYNPLVPSTALAVTNHGINVSANGWDIWGTSDAFQFTHRLVTGNFDIKVRLNKFDGADSWSKAGLMARPTLLSNSRFFMIGATPATTPVAGQTANNNFICQSRFTDGGSTAGLNITNVTTTSATAAPQYPNAWVRLQRIGSVFNGYISTNGTDWVLLDSRETASFSGGAFAESLYVGLATASHDQTRNLMNNTFVEYRDLSFPLAPVITAQPAPADATVALGSTVSFTGLAVAGEGTLTYQWRRNGLNIAGATSDTLTLNNVQVADSGIYTVAVGNEGGAVISSNCVLVVNNGLPVVATDTVAIDQGTVTNILAADLLANDTDPESMPLTILSVSGLSPVTLKTNLDEGSPAGALFYQVNNPGGGLGARWLSSGGVTNSGYVRITDGATNLQGAFILSELTPGKRVSAFSLNFKLRISNVSGEPADGISVNFAPNLPNATSGGGENGVGNGLSFGVDNYRFLPYVGVGTPLGGGPSTGNNTSGLKLMYNGTNIAGVQVPTWNSPDFIPVSINVSADGVATVYVNGTNVFGNVTLPGYKPTVGRFGFYARTGGQFQSHCVDDLDITVLTLDTARGYDLFGAAVYGSAYIGSEIGVPNSGALHLTDALNSQSGSYVINEITPGAIVDSINASFKVRIGQGTADGADGMSFNFGDMPNGTAPGEAEQGVGTGLSLCFKNYPAAGPGAPSIKVKFGGVEQGIVLIPKWNSTAYVPVNVVLEPDGTVDVVVAGTNVFSNLQLTNYVARTGRFGFFARTGGQNENHWVDDINLTVGTAGGSATYAANFNNGGPGQVTLTNGIVTYNPGDNACGTDTFYYLASDGQVGGATWAAVSVSITPTNGALPSILTCVPSRTVPTGANCAFVMPDLRGQLIASGNCLNIVQTPAPGSTNPIGAVSVTFTVTDALNNSVQCQTTVTGVDTTAPTITCVPDLTVDATSPAGAVVDFIAPAANDDCPVTVTSVPASGSTFPLGTNVVTVSAVDPSGNSNGCTFLVIVRDVVAPAVTCPSTVVAEASSAAGAAVTFSATVADAVDSNSTVIYSPASGSVFPLGTNTVEVTVYDASGNTNTCSFLVAVLDTTAPVISCSTNQTVAATDENGAVVTFSVSAADLVDPAPLVITSRASGSTFPIGTNVVNVTASDVAGNTNTCSFVVVVQSPIVPTLAITKSGADVVVSWEQTPGVTFLLEETLSLVSPVEWATNTATVEVVEGRNSVTITTSGTKFFRLKKQVSP